MKYMLGDLLNIESGIIAHQTNMYGVMGAGIALLLSRKFSDLEPSYREYCEKKSPNLGCVFCYMVNDQLAIANCFTQEDVCLKCSKGKILDPNIPIQDTSLHPSTDYDSIERAFKTLYKYYPDKTVYIPFLYGCGIAGGDWSIVENIMKEYKGDLVVVCRPVDLQGFIHKCHVEKKDSFLTQRFEKILATAGKIN